MQILQLRYILLIILLATGAHAAADGVTVAAANTRADANAAKQVTEIPRDPMASTGSVHLAALLEG